MCHTELFLWSIALVYVDVYACEYNNGIEFRSDEQFFFLFVTEERKIVW